MIKNGEITLVFTTVDETRNAIADSRSIRTTAQANGVTYYTTISAARAVMEDACEGLLRGLLITKFTYFAWLA